MPGMPALNGSNKWAMNFELQPGDAATREGDETAPFLNRWGGIIVWACILVAGVFRYAVWPRLATTDQRIATFSILVGLLSVLLGALTVLLVVRQITIADRQTDLMVRELAITEDQGKILARQDEQLNRWARLAAWVSDYVCGEAPAVGLSHERRVDIFVANVGKRTAQGATIQLLFPQGLSISPLYVAGGSGPVWQKTGEQRWPIPMRDGEFLVREKWEAHLARPFYINAAVKVDSLALFHASFVGNRIEYRILYDDGATPGYNGWLPLVKREEMDMKDVPTV